MIYRMRYEMKERRYEIRGQEDYGIDEAGGVG